MTLRVTINERLGVVLDGIFCAFVIGAALGMVVLASGILFVERLTAPIVSFFRKLRSRP